MAKITKDQFGYDIIEFDNGVVCDQVYEPHGVEKMVLNDKEYILAHGHEQIFVFSPDGAILFKTWTR